MSAFGAPGLDGLIKGTTWLIYVDDSGNEAHDVLTAVCFPVENWATYLGNWKNYRKFILKKVGFPLASEFHAQSFLKRKLAVEDPKTGASVMIPYEVQLSNGERISRPKLFEKGVRTIAACDSLRVLTCYSPVPNGAGKLYGPLLELIEEFLEWADSRGVVWFDGLDGAMASSRRYVHRSLNISKRRVLEDGVPVDSRNSHLIQMSDTVAYSAAFRAVRGDGPPSSPRFVSLPRRAAVPRWEGCRPFPVPNGAFGFREVQSQ